MAEADDYYAILGVEKDATQQEIVKAYRKLALTCHPDRGGDAEQFSRISKAHETLSDAKSRARYDSSGRTSPLSPEEEFRESFFNLSGAKPAAKKAAGGRQQVSEADKEEARRREVERQEAQRRLDEADRRDAERRARLNGGAPPAPTPAAAPAPAAAAGPTAVLVVGMRVQLHSLTSRPELNGLVGVLIAQVADKWQVRLDGDGGEKLMKTKNLAPAPAPAAVRPAPVPSRPAAAPTAPVERPPQAAAMAVTQEEMRCAHPLCNYLVHSDPKLTRTHCCRACQGSPSNANPNHGPQCQKRPAAKAAAAQPTMAASRPAVKPQVPPVQPAMPSEQPTHRYQVVIDTCFVRQDPFVKSPAYGTKQRGDIVTAAEETFDGWVHLADEPGWIIKDMQGVQNVGQVLSPLGGEPSLAVPRPLGRQGPANFKVVFKPHIALRAGPNKQAQIMGVKKFGEAVIAEVQTYGGWVRLQGANIWALTTDTTFGKLLECSEVQSQAKAQQAGQAALVAELNQAVRNSDASLIQNALVKCRTAGVDKAQTQAAEQALIEIKSRAAKKAGEQTDFKRRVEKAKENEKELRECIDDGAKLGFREETILAQKLLNELLEQRSKTQQKHQGLLERLASAAASGDKQEMKAARDAAQKGGVDKKEIARIFSLNIIDSAAKPTQVLSEAPQPAAAACAPAAAPAAEPAVESSEIPSLASLEFSLGVRVLVQGLCNRQELNGVAGVLVAQRERHWQVLLFNGAGMKLFKEGNLKPYDKNSPDAPSVSFSYPSAPTAAPGEEQEPAAAPAQEVPSESGPTPEESRALLFDGRWIGQDDEWMGTIEGATIQWADGPLVDLVFLSERSFSCEMSAEGVTETFSAELDDEGRLLWCDGDLWTRE